MSRPRPNRPSTWNWWLRDVMAAYSAAEHAWWLAAEAASNGWATELSEFAAEHPRPRLREFLESFAHPERIAS
jgi:hypothetical protein